MYKYSVSLSAGFGVISKDLNVLAENKHEALCAALAICEREHWFAFFYDIEEMNARGVSDAKRKEFFIYLDPTTVDPAARPAYIAKTGVICKKVA